MNTFPNNGGPQLPPELHSVLILMGRGLGTVSVYGANHPSVDQIVSHTFQGLQAALEGRGSVAIGSHNGSITVDDKPVIAREVPIRTLEKRLIAMKVSHLTLHKGLAEHELKQLLIALCAPSDTDMKETLAQSGLEHIEMEDVKYVILRDGEEKTGKGQGGGKSSKKGKNEKPVEIPPAQVGQIIAFLKGQAGSDNDTENLKKALSDPEKLGQMIMEAAAIRQAGVDVQAGESLADIVIGCLRRTYEGLRKEKEFKSLRGKTNLSKAMMLLEKTVLDKIHASMGDAHPEIDKRIMSAIRELEQDREFEVLTAHYFSQNKKTHQSEAKIIDAIKAAGRNKAREHFEESEIPSQEWQRLMVQAGEGAGTGTSEGGGFTPGLDMSALAVVLEKLEDLMQLDSKPAEEVRAKLEETKGRLQTYTDQIEQRIQELEGQVRLDDDPPLTVEHNVGDMKREELMKEVSELTLALVQPLTVINASIEAAMHHQGDESQKDLLDLAHVSGKRMQDLAKRLMILVGYPILEPTVLK